MLQFVITKGVLLPVVRHIKLLNIFTIKGLQNYLFFVIMLVYR